MGTTIQGLKSNFTNFLYIFADLTVGEGGNFSQCLERINLYIKTVNRDSPKETLHDKVSLVFVKEVLFSARYGPLKGLYCNLAKLDMTLVYVADCCVQYLPNLILRQVFIDILIKKFTQKSQSLHYSPPK